MSVALGDGTNGSHFASSGMKQRASTLPLSEPEPTDRPDLDRVDSSSDPGHRFSNFSAESSESQPDIPPGLQPGLATENNRGNDEARLSYGEDASGAPSTHSYVSFDTESGPEYTPHDEQSYHAFQRPATESDSDDGPYDVSEDHLPLAANTNLDDTIRQPSIPLPPRVPLKDIVQPDEDDSSSWAADAAAAAAFTAKAGPDLEAPLPDLPGTFLSSAITEEPDSNDTEPSGSHIPAIPPSTSSSPKGLATPRGASNDTAVVPAVNADDDAELASGSATRDAAETTSATTIPSAKPEDTAPTVPDSATISAHLEPSALTESESIRVPRTARLSAIRAPPASPPLPSVSERDVRTSISTLRQSTLQATPRPSATDGRLPVAADTPQTPVASVATPKSAPRTSFADRPRPGANEAPQAPSSASAPSNALPGAASRAPEESAPPKPLPKPVEPKTERDAISTQDRMTSDNLRRPPLPSGMSQMDTQYVNMLLALDSIPQLHNIAASFATWILLAGFVLFPGTFTSLQQANGEGLGGAGALVLGAVRHVPLFVIAWICTGVGAFMMLYLWYRWQKNYIWVTNRIFMPGLLNSLAGILSTLSSVLGVQHSTLSVTSKATIIVTSSVAGVCGFLTLFYQFVLIAGVKKKHDQQIGKQRAGKHGEGFVDTTKRKLGIGQHSDV